MSKNQLDPIIHAPIRLKICAFLVPLEDAEFQVLRDELGVSDSVLSKHASKLVEAGYLKLRKSSLNGRQHTWARLSSRGRKALCAHVNALQEIVSTVDASLTGN